MRLGLIVLLCLLNTGCALWRRDREEPVENGPRKEKAEPVLKPSEALKPKSLEMASPISDYFFMRGSYFQGDVVTELRLSSTGANPAVPDGDRVSLEDDFGLDDVVNQATLEFDIRMRERNHLRINYFKLNRFGQVAALNDVAIGDFDFEVGDPIRTKFDWRVLSLTYTYSLFKAERFEAGVGLGVHIIEANYEISEPGTINRDQFSEVAPFATIAVNAAYRISKRWAVTARAQAFKLNRDSYDGTMSDYHGDIQYRWRKNFAVGLGYSKLFAELNLRDADQPVLFSLDTSGPELFFRASF
ncbi:MAG TPA: hypothetical protein VGO61_10945 [Steroidobacteraceae bacterium]|jgi:hypothetical protein|nr:hypothetical protein [Steroidobacteraceae bacterium]